MTAAAVAPAGLATMPVDEDRGLSMMRSPAEAATRYRELQAFVKSAMVRGVDYGNIPGTGDRPVLLQPGAQKLAELYGFAVSFVDISATEDWDDGIFAYRKKCVLTSRLDGRFIGDGVGSCNSKEERYAYRWVGEKTVPADVDKGRLRTKKSQYGTQYRVPNEEVFSLVNTIEKMACKRALVHAVIGATRSSGLFTQDVEDLPAEMFGRPAPARSWQKSAVVEAPTQPAETAAHDDDGVVVDTTDDLAGHYAEQYAAAKTLDELGRVRAAAKEAYNEGKLSKGDITELAACRDKAMAGLIAKMSAKHFDPAELAEQ